VTKKKSETVHLSSIRVPVELVEFIKTQMEKHVFNSVTHGIVRLAFMGMEKMTDDARVVHHWERDFISKKKNEEKG